MSYETPNVYADWSEIGKLHGVYRIIKKPGLIEAGQAVYLPKLSENMEFSGITTDASAGEHIGWAVKKSNGDTVDVLLQPSKKARV